MFRRSSLTALLLFAPAAFAQVPMPTADQGAALARALAEARTGDWEGADRDARPGGPTAVEVIDWLRLRDGASDWSDYRDFLARDSNWPGAAQIRRRAEVQMPDDLPSPEVIAFFDTPPLTPTGSLRLANALKATGETEAAQAEISRAWTTMPMTGEEQGAIALDWGPTVTPLNAVRLDMLLWSGLTDQAENMLPLVDADWQLLGRARIAVRNDRDGSTALIEALPKSLRADPGLNYERYLYRVKKGRWQDAAEVMASASTSAATLGRPDFWMDRRANLAREALQRGDVPMAYALASGGHGTSGSDYADSEWLAGYIALILMKDPARAIGHFERFQTLVFTPISLGRAGYWLGLAHAAAGDTPRADTAFRAAATYQTSFYGQLAAGRAGIAFDPTLAGATAPADWRADPATSTPLARAAYLLLRAGDEARASQFFRQAAKDQPAASRAALAQMAIDIGVPHIGIRVAKDAAADGILLPAQYYPLDEIARQSWAVPTELALAIARQESELNPAAGSDAGARGLMQLMPATAQHVAQARGLPYSALRLTRDPLYNARLGTEYLADMLARYDGSYVLAAAAYNAGPGRVDQWLAANGDPRAPGTDPVVWIEAIPYSETRNYVMRVLEGMQVYRLRLNGAPQPVQLAADINTTG